jgi:hypothetical protein
MTLHARQAALSYEMYTHEENTIAENTVAKA